MSALSANLKMFTGTQQWFRHPLSSNFLYTDGVKFFAEHCGGGAYWFLDILATELADLQEKEEFMSITLDVVENSAETAGFLQEKEDSISITDVVDRSAKITVDDGNGNVIWTRNIHFTDAEKGSWKFFFTNNVLLLPSEN